MMTWTLIIILFGANDSVAVSSVPGFASRAACAQAMSYVSDDVTKQHGGVSVICVEVK